MWKSSRAGEWVKADNRFGKAPTNKFLQADRGDSAGKLNLQHPEGDPDPEGDLSPPTAAEK